MNLKASPIHSSRSGGCTLTGALSVTTHVRDAISIIHGPKGCTHHNFSLFHATGLDNDNVTVPDLVSSALSESDIVFGGEDALERTIQEAAQGRKFAAVFVLSTCVVETIGDDVEEVCSRKYGVPVVPVPTAGFLGGTFHDGVNKALIALAGLAQPVEYDTTINIIGEMNLEYEVEENYVEVCRLLARLGRKADLRFVHTLEFEKIQQLGAAQLNILRDPTLVPFGEYLQHHFGTPFISSFPRSFSESLAFLDAVAATCGIESRAALDAERGFQAEVLADFSDMRNSRATFRSPVADAAGLLAARQAAESLDIRIVKDGDAPVLPVQPVVGTAGVKRMLHRWRRALHAGM